MWGFLQEDPQRFSALTIRSFQQSEDLIRARGPHWIGQDAALNALHGLSTIIRIAKVATRLFDQENSVNLRADDSSAELWTNSIIAYALAFSAVLSSLTALANGRTTTGRLENVPTLANWSKSYAVRAYHFTKVLSEAGLDSYAEMLHQDDQR